MYNQDLEDGGVRMPFNKLCFKRMLERTFEDYYPTMYNLEPYDLDECLALIGEEQLETKYGVYLENSPEN